MTWKDGAVELDTGRWTPALAQLFDVTMETVADQRHTSVTECHLLGTLLRPLPATLLALPEGERERFRNAATLLKSSLADGVTVADCLEAFEVIAQVGSVEIDPFERGSWREPLPGILEGLADGSGIPDLLAALLAALPTLGDADLLTDLLDRERLLASLSNAAARRTVVKDEEVDEDAFTPRALSALRKALAEAAQAGAATCDTATVLTVMLTSRDTYTQLIVRRAGLRMSSPKADSYFAHVAASRQVGAPALPPAQGSLSEGLLVALESALDRALATGGRALGERELLGSLLKSEEPRLRYLVDDVLAVPLSLVEEAIEALDEPDLIVPHLPSDLGPVRNVSVGLAQSRRPFPVAREDVTTQIAKVFFRLRDRNVLLHGEHGTGLSSMADVLAAALLVGRFPALRHTQVIAFDLSGLAGPEPRSVAEQVLASGDADGYAAAAEKVLSFVEAEPDRIYVLEGFARYFARHFKACARRFRRNASRLLVVADPAEYTELTSGEEPLENFFDVIELSEPAPDATTLMIDQAMARLGLEYGVTFAAKAGDVAMRMAGDYMLAARFPAKAVSLLERAAADVAAQAEMAGEGSREVDRQALARRVATVTGLPVETILGTGKDKDYVDLLSTNLVGQEAAVLKVAGRLDLIQKGLVDKSAPAAVFVFAGLSGTGKTELAKQIAQIYSQTHAMISFAMENCGEAYSVSKLIGAPPGYVGYEQGGPLINALNRDPYSVVLLDEIEKAHPMVWDPFLHLFDEGTVTDSRGVTASGARAFFVLTSNIGQYEIASMLARGASQAELEDTVMKMFPAYMHEQAHIPCFRPEFIGRIMRRGGIVAFNALSRDALLGIARHGFARIARDFSSIHEGRFVCDDDVLEMIADAVFAENEAVISQRHVGYLGARRIQQLLDQHVNSKLAEKIRQITDAPLVRIVLKGSGTELVPVYAEGDVQALIAENRAQLVGRVERRFNQIVTAPDDAFTRLSDDRLTRLDRLLTEVGAIL